MRRQTRWPDVDFSEMSEEYRERVYRDHKRASKRLGWSNAQVDLIAPPEVTATASQLRRALLGLQLQASLTVSAINAGTLKWRPPNEEELEAADQLREAFVRVARASVGTDGSKRLDT